MWQAGSTTRGLGLGVCLAAILLAAAAPAAAQEEEHPLPPPAPAADDALTAALESGELTEAEYALERARSVFQLERVRREFGDVSRPSGRDTTLILRDLAARLSQLTGADRAVARAILARPTGGGVPIGHGYSVESVFTCGADMCFHWVESTEDGAEPDWVSMVQQTWEDVWGAEIDAVGYREPRRDGASNQTDGPVALDKGKLDVYILDLGQDAVFGYCASLADDPTTAVYCAVDNDYAPEQYGRSQTPEGFLQVTAAHEFHHASQAAYDFWEDYWLIEGTAANMEETVYPAIDDNVTFLDLWSPLTRPASPLDRGGFGNSEYGAWIFWRFLEEKIGGSPDIVREIWERADAFDPSPLPGDNPPDDYSLQAVRHELAERGRGFSGVFADFATANRRGDYADAEAAGYPTPQLTKTFTVGLNAPLTPWHSWRINHLSTRLLAFKPGGDVPADARLRVSTRLPKHGAGATLIVVDEDGSTSTRRLDRNAKGYARGTVRFGQGDVKRVEVVLTNGSTRMGQCFTRPGPPSYSCLGRSLDDQRVFELRGALRP
ncbi:MAG TPA: MXAN_6640 family putative metalloprotease [Gaiellaceae bacterium]|nr:MXAN_6640 family putative metalloprotease [Gaiellaceae bacterium]